MPSFSLLSFAYTCLFDSFFVFAISFSIKKNLRINKETTVHHRSFLFSVTQSLFCLQRAAEITGNALSGNRSGFIACQKQ